MHDHYTQMIAFCTLFLFDSCFDLTTSHLKYLRRSRLSLCNDSHLIDNSAVDSSFDSQRWRHSHCSLRYRLIVTPIPKGYNKLILLLKGVKNNHKPAQ